MMYGQVLLAGISTLLVVFISQSALAQECQSLGSNGYTQDKCSSENTIRVAGVTITKGTMDKRIGLSSSQTETEWFCGNTKERVAWGANGNNLRVNYLSDGTIQWTIFQCDGNPSSWPDVGDQGTKCAAVAVDVSCPSSTNASTPCVYEVSTSSTSGTSRTTKVSATIAGEVTGGGATASGSITGEVSKTKYTELTYNDKKYVVIPPGVAYCKYSEGEIVPDNFGPLGSKWECSQIKTKQYQFQFGTSSTCVELDRCDGYCEFSASPGVPGMGIAVVPPAFSLLVGFSALMTILARYM